MLKTVRACGIGLLITAVSPGLGCSGDDDAGGGADGGADDAGATRALDWSAPDVAAPMLGPCPDGWREQMDGSGLGVCEPFPEGGVASCGDDQAHFTGEPGCALVGDACTGSGVPAGLPADVTVVYVREGATGGDGTMASPYGALTEFSLGRLGSGAVVALAAGTYEGDPIRLPRGLTLWGECTAGTILSSSVPSPTQGVLDILGMDVRLQNLSVADAPRRGVYLQGMYGVHLESVVVRDVVGVGIAVFDDASLTGNEVVVRNTAADPTTGGFGRALDILRSGTVDLTRVSFEQNHEVAVAVSMNGALALSDAVVRDTQSEVADLRGGRGFSVQNGGSMDLSRAVVRGNAEVGMIASDDGSITADQVVVRDTASTRLDGQLGVGVVVRHGSSGFFSRLLVEGSHDAGLTTFSPGSVARFTDVIVRDTLPREADDAFGFGMGVVAYEGADLTLARALFERNRMGGVVVVRTGTGTLSDLTVRETAAALSGGYGYGLNVEASSRVDVERARFESNRDTTVFAQDAETVLRLTDAALLDTAPRADGSFGRAIGVQYGASVEVERIGLVQAREIGFFGIGDGTSINATDVSIEDTRPQDCSVADCAETPWGIAVGTFEQAAMSLSRFEIRRADLCGLVLATGAELDLSDGTIRDCAIGACLQVEGYDLDRLTNGVRYVENGINLDAVELPVPASGPALPTF